MTTKEKVKTMFDAIVQTIGITKQEMTEGRSPETIIARRVLYLMKTHSANNITDVEFFRSTGISLRQLYREENTLIETILYEHCLRQYLQLCSSWTSDEEATEELILKKRKAS